MRNARWNFLACVIVAGATAIGFYGCSSSDGDKSLVGSDTLQSAAALDAAQPAPAAFGQNLVTNGGAEADIGGGSTGTGPAPSGWTRTTGNLEVIKYSAGGGFPGPSTPGPSGRGNNFFSGGLVPPTQSQIEQTKAVGWAAGAIDTGNALFSLSAWLGGFASHNDTAKVKIEFLNSLGAVLGQRTIGPVTAALRGNVTKFLKRSSSGTVPRKTRSIRITVIMTEATGYNDGYADNISLVLRRRP